jgi:hypothetical protein
VTAVFNLASVGRAPEPVQSFHNEFAGPVMMLLTRVSEGSPSDRADALREIRTLAQQQDTVHSWAVLAYALAVTGEQDESFRLFDHLDRFPDNDIVGVARTLSRAALSDRAEGANPPPALIPSASNAFTPTSAEQAAGAPEVGTEALEQMVLQVEALRERLEHSSGGSVSDVVRYGELAIPIDVADPDRCLRFEAYHRLLSARQHYPREQRILELLITARARIGEDCTLLLDDLAQHFPASQLIPWPGDIDMFVAVPSPALVAVAEDAIRALHDEQDEDRATWLTIELVRRSQAFPRSAYLGALASLGLAAIGRKDNAVEQGTIIQHRGLDWNHVAHYNLAQAFYVADRPEMARFQARLALERAKTAQDRADAQQLLNRIGEV